MRTSYRLNGVQTGSVVIRAHDKYRGDFTKGFDVGILVRKTASRVHIRWAGDEDQTIYDQGDARYEVDRGRWKFLGLMGPNPLDPDDPVSVALTKLRQSIRVPPSAAADTPAPTTEGAGSTEEEEDMAEQSKAAREREAAQRALKNGDMKDRETYTAKQIAARCGTDAKTMRKFFRSSHSTVDPVGQGGRYEFAATDLPKIRREFDSWRKRAESRRTGPKLPTVTNISDDEKAEQMQGEVDKFNDAIEQHHDELEEPTEEDLAELEDLDLDDLDALED